MKIAIDARGVHSKLQGIGRHVLNLLLGLSFRESDLEFIVIYNDPLARKLVEKAGGPFRGRFQWVKSMSGVGQMFERLEIPWLLKIHRADLFHDVNARGAWTANIPTVATVHEVSSPDNLRRTLRDSRMIIAVSQSVASEIESDFHISRPKIRVILNGIDPWYNERVTDNEIRYMRERFKLQGPYFLCVTANKPTKNVEFVQKFAHSWSGAEKWIFTIPGTDSDKFRFLDIVDDTWLRPLYAASSAVIAPSLYEGFSLPPIEALATGALPVVSDIPPHREALADILTDDLFFDPMSTQELHQALQKAVDGQESLKNAVLEKFRIVRQRYSFVDTAAQIHAVYHEALK